MLFPIVSNIFKNILSFGNNTMSLSNIIMDLIFDYVLPFWGGKDKSGTYLQWIDDIIDECESEIGYEYDSDITLGQEYFPYDHIKFPVETAFRRRGDCEDQAIFTSAFLETCGQETAIILIHDPDYNDGFYHAALILHITDIFWFNFWYPLADLYSLGGIDPYSGYSWCFIDPTWDINFGSTPSWVSHYKSVGFSWDTSTIVICDIDGAIGENSGLTCVMPT